MSSEISKESAPTAPALAPPPHGISWREVGAFSNGRISEIVSSQHGRESHLRGSPPRHTLGAAKPPSPDLPLQGPCPPLPGLDTRVDFASRWARRTGLPAYSKRCPFIQSRHQPPYPDNEVRKVHRRCSSPNTSQKPSHDHQGLAPPWGKRQHRYRTPYTNLD